MKETRAETSTADSLWERELNPQQRAAVLHGEGPLLIVAGAGTGKTRTLAYRVAYLIHSGVPPDRLLLLTFTRRAAEEMLKRAAEVLARGPRTTTAVWGGTFHAIANRLLRQSARVTGLRPDFTVLDEADAEDLLDVVRHDLGLVSRDRPFPRKSTCRAIYSRCVNGDESLSEVLERFFPWCLEWEAELRRLFARYVERKQQGNVLDYDDLLLYWARLLSDEGMARRMGEQFAHVLVDEYQDTNCLQAEILRGLRRFNPNVTVVGDDAQSIYSFRAATIRNMLDFPRQFPGTTILRLEQNYRSVMPILELTNRVIARARERHAKTLWSIRTGGARPKLVQCRDESQQDAYVVERVLEHYEQGIPLRHQAVLFRAAHLSDSLEVELGRHHIPFHKYGGLRFLETAHVKDLLAFLRVIENPRDQMAWFRLLQLLEGIGPATAHRLIERVAAEGFCPAAIGEAPAPAPARPLLTRLAQVFEEVTRRRLPVAAEVERIREFYEPILRRLYERVEPRLRDLEHLERLAAGYRSRRQFLVDLQLDPPTSTSDLAGVADRHEDWLVLSTIHSAKGCEWDVVYLIHASDGCLPSDMATDTEEDIEEERRLAYVAMTRARDYLYVTWPLRYYHRWSATTDRHVYAQLSRFLSYPEVREAMDVVVLAQQESPGEGSTQETSPLNLPSEMRRMWE